jgi:Tetraspanin family
MCWRLKAVTLKLSIYLLCLISFVCGSVMVWLGFLVSSSSLIWSLGYAYAGYFVSFCGFMTILLAFLGFAGVWNNRKMCLGTFGFSSIMSGLVLIIFGSIIINIRTITAELFMDQSTCMQNFPDADALSALGGEVLCGLYCPCDIKGFKSPTQDYYTGSALNTLDCNPCENIQEYDERTQDQIVSWIKYNLGYTVTNTSCAITANQFTSAYYSKNYLKYLTLVTWLEDYFKCSGICTAQELLLFTDLNSQRPTGACYSSLKYWANQNLVSYGVVSALFGIQQIVAGSFALVLLFCTRMKIERLPTTADTKTRP